MTRKRTNPERCTECGRNMPSKAARGLCKTCYNRAWRKAHRAGSFVPKIRAKGVNILPCPHREARVPIFAERLRLKKPLFGEPLPPVDLS